MHITVSIMPNGYYRSISKAKTQTVPVLRNVGMASATGDALEKAAGIHGISIDELMEA